MAWTWKAPLDVFDYALDFSALLAAGEALDTIVSVASATDPGGVDSTAAIISSTTVPAISGTTVVFWLQGGSLGDRHIVQATVTTSAGREYTGVLHLTVMQV